MEDAQKKTILVIEDERPLLEAIKHKLQIVGLDAVTVRSAEQAINYLNELKVDGIWLDHYLMGSQSGIDLVAQLKEESSPWKNIPIFVVSNTADNEKVSAYMQLGVEKYFIKSNFRLDQIIAEIQETLEKVR